MPGSSRPFLSRVSICARSAEKKISAGAPSSICRARPLDGPKLNFTVCFDFDLIACADFLQDIGKTGRRGN